MSPTTLTKKLSPSQTVLKIVQLCKENKSRKAIEIVAIRAQVKPELEKLRKAIEDTKLMKRKTFTKIDMQMSALDSVLALALKTAEGNAASITLDRILALAETLPYLNNPPQSNADNILRAISVMLKNYGLEAGNGKG